MGLFLSVVCGIIGPAFLWLGKKRENTALMLWGAGLTIASYLLF